jgi:hypothetical protein
MKILDFIIFVFLLISVFFINLLIVKSEFSSSVERGRYALTRAMVEQHTFRIDSYKDFSYPDVSVRGGHYYSRFPAGMPVLMIPIHSFALTIKNIDPKVINFAFLGLLSAIAIGLLYFLGVTNQFSRLLSLFISFCFAFSTLIFSFAGGFWSHTISLFFITIILLLFSQYLKTKKNILVFFIALFFGVALSIDFPNAIILSPILMYILFTNYKVNMQKLFTAIFLLLFPIGIILGGIGVYNTISFGSPLAIGQSSKFSVGTKLHTTFIPMHEWNAKGVFDERRLFQGLYTQLFSEQRGLLMFSPILLLALLGIIPFFKEKKDFAIISLSVFAITILFYSVWQDYWGGWSYGPRYLIAAIPFLFLPTLYFFKTYMHKPILLVLFYIAGVWGICVNTLGAFTAALLPCPCEGFNGFQYSPLLALTQIDTLSKHSFMYTHYFSHFVTPIMFYLLLSFFLVCIFMTLFTVSVVRLRRL